ncbi:MAG: type II secretion system F family protein [Patescibacteria group bacterium]|nr:type II secretion system F family protein [Patescibacteria group bacterium]
MSETDSRPYQADRNRLTPSETMELAARLSELTRNGLPLGDGLRAVADEQPGSREATGLRRLAARIDAGEPLDAALREASLAGSRTAALERLLLLGARHHCLPELLEHCMGASASRAAVRRQLWTASAYPITLLLAICVVWVTLEFTVLAPISDIFADFDADLPAMTLVALALGRTSLTFLAILLAGLFLGPMAFAVGRRWEPTWWIVTSLPLLGSMFRWQSFAELGRGLVMALGGAGHAPDARLSGGSPSSPSATRARLPMPEAVRLAAAALADLELRRQCNDMVERLEQGFPAAEVFAQADVFPPNMAEVFRWADRHDTWPEAFESLTSWYEELVRCRLRLVETVFPPIIVVLVAAMLVVANMAMLMPFVSFMRYL